MTVTCPVLLGLLCSLLFLPSHGQETNQVYAYSYHFQHNGTTNSEDILRRVLGAHFEINGQSVVKTFSSPDFRGFFTQGVLPLGPLDSIKKTVESNQSPPAPGKLLQPVVLPEQFPKDFGRSSQLDAIKKVVESNLHPPLSSNLLPPVSPDLGNNFPGDFGHAKEDFPIIPPPPPVPMISFPTGPSNDGVSRVESYSRNTPEGGKIDGRIETFSYQSPNPNIQENSQGFRRSENYLNNNNNQQSNGFHSQSYFRRNFRTVTPNFEHNDVGLNNRVDNNNAVHNNNNQWWNVLSVLGENKNMIESSENLNAKKQMEGNFQKFQNNQNKQFNQGFGMRINKFNSRMNSNTNLNSNVPINNGYRNHNFNQNSGPRRLSNPTIPFNNRINSNSGHINQFFPQNQAINNSPIQLNNFGHGVNNVPFQNPIQNSNYANNLHRNGNQNDIKRKFDEDGTTKEVLNIINNVNSRFNLNSLRPNVNSRLTWDDDIPINFNSDWSRRESRGQRKPFSNGHSGSLVDGPKSVEALVENLQYPVPPIPEVDRSYRNVDGGGIERFFGVEKVIEGPNFYNQNHQRGFERNFHVNSNLGYEKSNQWSTNRVRRLDAQSSRPDFSKDFIDVFRDDY